MYVFTEGLLRFTEDFIVDVVVVDVVVADVVVTVGLVFNAIFVFTIPDLPS